MEWREDGVVLSVRRHGETSAIVETFTRSHGRHLGVVRGGTSRKLTPFLQPGAQLDLVWRARLDEHLGTLSVEPLKTRAAAVLGDRLALSALNSIVALAGFCLPERAAYPDLYDQTIELLDDLTDGVGWLPGYLHWECSLLAEMGFGLDLSACAVEGVNEDLAFVSPRTGRAVSRQAAGDWADRLLPLPPVMVGGPASVEGILAGLKTTGFFLSGRLAPSLGNRPLPAARQRFLDVLARQT